MQASQENIGNMQIERTGHTMMDGIVFIVLLSLSLANIAPIITFIGGVLFAIRQGYGLINDYKNRPKTPKSSRGSKK